MFFHCLATDYDGTLAEHGAVADTTVEALERLRQSGRRIVLVTGRELADLERAFPRLDLFDRVVAENGALLYRPQTGEIVPLADPPPPAFVEALQRRGVAPLSLGHVIVASWEPNEEKVLDAIRECGLELQIIFNKGAVMVLPPGVNKASGLIAALGELSLSPVNAVGVGDAENDHALLKACGFAVAVANAVPMLKDNADWVTAEPRGAGVEALAARLLEDDLAGMAQKDPGRSVALAAPKDAAPIAIEARQGGAILVCGTSGSGKTTFTTGFIERLKGAGMQFCIVDPEGDYENEDLAISLGDARLEPSAAKAAELLERADANIAANLLALKLADRPPFLGKLALTLGDLHRRTGRPHWLVVDEAHHMLGPNVDPGAASFFSALSGVVFVTVHPGHIAPAVLKEVRWLVALGAAIDEAVRSFAKAAGLAAPDGLPQQLAEGCALVWRVGSGEAPVEAAVIRPEGEHLRHIRKYAEGELGADRSFYFRGPEGKLNLRARNLEMFCQIAEGIDVETWEFHKQERDYSRWMRLAIKDDELAEEIARIEASAGDPASSRIEICAAIARRYTKAA